MNHTHRATAASALLISLLAACASPPTEPPQLIEARQAVHEAEGNSAVQVLAPLELRKATEALDRANALAREGAPVEEVASAGYVATQRSRIALSIANAKTNDLSIAGAEGDRARVRADAATDEARRAQARTQSAERNTAMAQARTQTAERTAAVAQANALSADRNAAASQASAASAQQQTEQLSEQNRQMQQTLSELRARPTERGTVVTLHDVTFHTDQAHIQPAALPTLRKLADFLQRYPNRRVLIEGHTDSSGSPEHNVALSLRRADAVQLSLTQMGVSAQRLSTVGYGEDYPLADNLSAGNRAQNRRVEIYVGDSEAPVRPRR